MSNLTLPEAVQAIRALPYVLPAPLGCINRADVLALLARVDAVPAEPLVAKYEAALREIAEKRGLCIYRRDENGGADFREGSNHAFDECAGIADAAPLGRDG
jgi:hypothetical protein